MVGWLMTNHQRSWHCHGIPNYALYPPHRLFMKIYGLWLNFVNIKRRYQTNIDVASTASLGSTGVSWSLACRPFWWSKRPSRNYQDAPSFVLKSSSWMNLSQTWMLASCDHACWIAKITRNVGATISTLPTTKRLKLLLTVSVSWVLLKLWCS